jgi:hypothetical protein
VSKEEEEEEEEEEENVPEWKEYIVFPPGVDGEESPACSLCSQMLTGDEKHTWASSEHQSFLVKKLERQAKRFGAL